MTIDHYECAQCGECRHEIYFCNKCNHQICTYCLGDVADVITIDLECKEEMKYEEFLEYPDRNSYYFEIVECPYCIEDITKAQVDDTQIVDYVMKKYNLTKEQLEKGTKEDRCSS